MIDIIEWLQEFGYGGMFVAAFLAGSFFPFSSEAVMTALSLAGLNVWLLMLYSTLGNTLGGLFNYGVGRLGSDEWVYRLFKLKEERLEKTKRWVHAYGAYMGLLSWLPVFGSVITVALGILHIHFGKTLLMTFLGKFLRYLVLTIILTLLN